MFKSEKERSMPPFRSNKPRRDFGNSESSDRSFGGRPSGNRNFSRPSGNRSFGEKGKLFKATCSDCGCACEVPFQPRGNKPVLCERCFKKDGNGRGSFDNSPSPSGDAGKKQLDAINKKLDKILLLLEALVLDDEDYDDEDEDEFDEDEHQ